MHEYAGIPPEENPNRVLDDIQAGWATLLKVCCGKH